MRIRLFAIIILALGLFVPVFGRNVGRNTLIGPGVFNLDGSLLKNFYFLESKYLQFRFEAFNALNHPNWGNPSVNITNANSFGTIGGTRGNMRQLQLALKLVF